MNSSNRTQKLLKDIGFTLLSEGKTIRIKAEGYSMYPSIKPGAVIYIEPLVKGEIPPAGGIIAWKRETGLVVHRLIRTFKEGERTVFITRGDSKLSDDPPVTYENIAGKVVMIEDIHGRMKPASAYYRKRPFYIFNRFFLRINLTFGKISGIRGRLVSGH